MRRNRIRELEQRVAALEAEVKRLQALPVLHIHHHAPVAPPYIAPPQPYIQPMPGVVICGAGGWGAADAPNYAGNYGGGKTFTAYAPAVVPASTH